MILYINTKEQNKVEVALLEGKAGSVKGKVVKTLSAKNKFGSQALLPLIARMCTPGVLTQIEVETGPGSFTGLRVGVSVANALGFALNIPINGKKIETSLLY